MTNRLIMVFLENIINIAIIAIKRIINTEMDVNAAGIDIFF